MKTRWTNRLHVLKGVNVANMTFLSDKTMMLCIDGFYCCEKEGSFYNKNCFLISNILGVVLYNISFPFLHFIRTSSLRASSVIKLIAILFAALLKNTLNNKNGLKSVRKIYLYCICLILCVVINYYFIKTIIALLTLFCLC